MGRTYIHDLVKCRKMTEAEATEFLQEVQSFCRSGPSLSGVVRACYQFGRGKASARVVAVRGTEIDGWSTADTIKNFDDWLGAIRDMGRDKQGYTGISYSFGGLLGCSPIIALGIFGRIRGFCIQEPSDLAIFEACFRLRNKVREIREIAEVASQICGYENNLRQSTVSRTHIVNPLIQPQTTSDELHWETHMRAEIVTKDGWILDDDDW